MGSSLRSGNAIPSDQPGNFGWRLAAAGIPLLAAACSGDSPLSNIPGVVLFTIAAPVVLLAIRYLVRVDSFALCGVGMGASALAGLVLGAIGLVSKPMNPLALIGAVGCAGAFAACVRQRYRIAHGLVEDRVPNMLVERFGRQAVVEYEGVQVVLTGAQTVRPGEIAEACLYLQNCHDAPGDFVVKARLPKELRADQKASVPSEARVHLGPLAVGVMKLPILTAATLAPGNYPVDLEVGVEGLVGRRVRRWRAERIENKPTPWEFVALATMSRSRVAVIEAAFIEGLQYLLRVEGTPVLEERALPPVGYEVLWQLQNPKALPVGAEEQSAPVVEEAFDQIVEPEREPEPAVLAPENSTSRVRVCIGCAAEVDAEEAELIGRCPNCDAFWH